MNIFSLDVARHRPGDYLFSALLSSEQMFYPVVADNNVEAIIYPSVQKKKFSFNIAIRNDQVVAITSNENLEFLAWQACDLAVLQKYEKS